MKDLKHIHYYEALLEQADNELVRLEKEAEGSRPGIRAITYRKRF